MTENGKFLSLEALGAKVFDGAKVACFKDGGLPMAFARTLIRRGVRNLHLVTVPTGSLEADLLIAGGCLATLETSAVSLGEFGPAPAFMHAVKEAAVRVLDSTCPAIYAQLQAGGKGLPFVPLRGLIGSDLLGVRDDLRVIDNPFPPHDPVVVLPAIQPDFCLLHAAKADRQGNVWTGRTPELKSLAHASKNCLVTVEEIVDFDLLGHDLYGPATLPSFYVSALALAPRGAWPLAMPGYYGRDDDHLTDYCATARRPNGFSEYLERHVFTVEAAQ